MCNFDLFCLNKQLKIQFYALNEVYTFSEKYIFHNAYENIMTVSHSSRGEFPTMTKKKFKYYFRK